VAKPFLVHGRMLKPLPLEGIRSLPMVTRFDAALDFPSLFTSRWRHGGRTAQVVVNYTPDRQSCTLLDLSGTVVVHRQAQGQGETVVVRDGRLELTIPPLSAILVEARD
jgi:hypothetical protein